MGDEEAALSEMALVELVHGTQRANTPQVRLRREAFIQELLADVPISVHPASGVSGGLNQRRTLSKGAKIPF